MRDIKLHQSQVTKDRIRRALKGRVIPEATREKMRQAQLGKKHSPEARARIKIAAQHRPNRSQSTATRERLRQSAQGRLHSPETKEKIRRHRLTQIFPQKMTDIEQILCYEFKKRRLKFEMHKTMFDRFQPDFVFLSAQLIVEADGDYWHRVRPDRKAGHRRLQDAAIAAGWTIWRFAESEIKQHPAICGRSVARFVRDHISSSA